MYHRIHTGTVVEIDKGTWIDEKNYRDAAGNRWDVGNAPGGGFNAYSKGYPTGEGNPFANPTMAGLAATIDSFTASAKATPATPPTSHATGINPASAGVLAASAGAGAYAGYKAGGAAFGFLGAIAALGAAVRLGLSKRAGDWWTKRQSHTDRWTDESHYTDKNGSVWTVQFEGGAWSATSDRYRYLPTPGAPGFPGGPSGPVIVTASVAEGGRDALAPKIDHVATNEAEMAERGKALGPLLPLGVAGVGDLSAHLRSVKG